MISEQVLAASDSLNRAASLLEGLRLACLGLDSPHTQPLCAILAAVDVEIDDARIRLEQAMSRARQAA